MPLLLSSFIQHSHQVLFSQVSYLYPFSLSILRFFAIAIPETHPFHSSFSHNFSVSNSFARLYPDFEPQPTLIHKSRVTQAVMMMLINLVLVIFALVTPTFTFQGDITFYSPGLGSCGILSSDSEPVVALAVSMMNNPANPNKNPKCGTQVHIFNPKTGETHSGIIVDTCYSCQYEDLDLSHSLFQRIAPYGNGRVHGMRWTFAGWIVQGYSEGKMEESFHCLSRYQGQAGSPYGYWYLCAGQPV